MNEQPEQTLRLFLNDRFVAIMPIQEGHAYCNLVAWAQALGLEPGWDAERAMVSLDGKLMPDGTLLFTRQGRAFVWIGDLVRFSGLQANLDSTTSKLTVSRPTPST